MALFSIGDLHLSFAAEKQMDVFEGWADYAARLDKKWRERVSKDDVVVLPGDLSWAMRLDEAKEDFAFVESLPGKKIILKGNHDYWWTTKAKLENWFSDNSFSTISILSNNSYAYGEYAIAGTRGWQLDPDDEKSLKVYRREANRLRLSLNDAKAREPREILVFLHYPPVFAFYTQTEIIEILQEFGVKRCYYGHVHGSSIAYAVNREAFGICFKLVSADYLRFSPYRIL